MAIFHKCYGLFSDTVNMSYGGGQDQKPIHRAYKNHGVDNRELRRRRNEEGVRLRKAQREQAMLKRRNLQVRICV